MGKIKIKDGKINFSCLMNNCKHSCCGPFAGISDEISSVDKRPFDEIVLTPEDRKILEENGFSELIEEGFSEQMNKKYYKMALKSDGTCKAFKDGKCTIHEFSPTLCKAFPFYIDMFAGLCTIDCDGFRDDVWTDLDNCKFFLENSKKMYEFWIDFYTNIEDNTK